MRYRKVKIDGRTHNAHRRKMEEALVLVDVVDDFVGPELAPELDNRLENLQVLSHEEHSRLLTRGCLSLWTCEHCGAEYEPPPTKRARSKSCSRDCMRALMAAAARKREARKREARKRALTGAAAPV